MYATYPQSFSIGTSGVTKLRENWQPGFTWKKRQLKWKSL